MPPVTRSAAGKSPVLSGFVQVSTSPDIQIFYTTSSDIHASPQKPLLVLSNSLAAATPLWDDFFAAFSSSYSIIRYDARFHGQSPLSSDPNFDYAAGHTLDDLASDVVTLLDSIGVPRERPVEAFIGLSVGAGIGVILASRYPDRFKKFIIVGTKAKALPGDSTGFDDRIAYAREHGIRAQGRQSLERWFDSEWITANPIAAKAIEDMVGSQNLQGFIASAAGLRIFDLWPHAHSIRQQGLAGRLLFVVGEKDAPAVVEDTKQLAEEIGSEVVVVPRAGHIVNVQQPARFHTIVQSHLEKL